jgi:AraC-like DNA-binding protein
MNFEEFAADLPLEHSLQFSSAEESEETLHQMGIEQPVHQIGKGSFRYRLAFRSAADTELFADRFSTAVSLHLEPPAGSIAFLFPRTTSGQFLASGQPAGDKKLIIMPSGSGTDIVIPELSGSEAIIIPQHRFTEMIDAMCPALHAIGLKDELLVSGDVARLHALRRATRLLIARSDADPHGENSANLVADLLIWLEDCVPELKPKRLRENVASARGAKLARDYIEDQYREPVHLETLCRTTGISARSLQRGFRNYFDQTLTEYVKTVRLDNARRELQATDAALTSVACIAMRHGNAHLGRFSVAYRERFGESPRATLAG